MNKNLVLLKNLLLSTSMRNSCKYCKDKKKRGKIVGGMVGNFILYLMLMTFCIAECVGLGYYGTAEMIPAVCAAVISILAFVLTLFKTNGYLFAFKEYDMLMSLPFEPKAIAACKFMYMYVKSLPWYASISVSMLAVYGYFAKPALAVYPVWAILSLFLPVIPMLLAAFLGFLIAKLGSGFKNKTIAQTVLSIMLVLACFGLRFFLEDMFRENKTEEVVTYISDMNVTAGQYYPPIEWFRGASADLKISDMLLLVGVTALLFELIFIPVGRAYRRINSALKSHSAKGEFKMTEQKSRSVLGAVVFKEFRRMTGSAVYMTNALIGELFCLIAGIGIMFADVDKLIAKAFEGAPLTKEMLCPAIPFIVYFFVGMVSTAAFTPSLEGKNYWIVQSLPIPKKTLYRGKMLYNFLLTTPFALFATISLSVSAKATALCTVLYAVLVIILCAFSSAWGCVCGIKHMRLDWENEVEVIKQGSAMTVYMFPNMIVTIVLTGLVVYLGTMIEQTIVTGVITGIAAVLTVLAYLGAMALADKR
ncbi:MAG: hypothetical protein K6B74_04620 [Ruminococcus sp.]|nr:hypothetical protein [Ruminococcus sp.]